MPASPDTLSGLLIQEDQATIYNAFLTLAAAIGLPVTSWQPGDPTRSLGFLESTEIEALEVVVAGFIRSGFLDYALGMWLVILAKQQFNVDVPAAVPASGSVTLTNAGGGTYTIDPGDLTLASSSTGQTYANTTGGTLTRAGTSGATLSISVQASVAGAVGSAAAGEIDTLETPLLGVTCTNPIALVGIDQQDPATTVSQCRNKLSSLSPNGAAGAYEYVALTPALTGINTVTRARAYPNSETGNVVLYVAGPSGAVASGDVAAVQSAVQTICTPLCITPQVLSANPVSVNLSYTLWLYSSVNQTTAQIEAAVVTALENLLASKKIGGDIIPPNATGGIFLSLLQTAIGEVFPASTFRVAVTAPLVDIALANGDVAELGTVTPTVVIVPGP